MHPNIFLEIFGRNIVLRSYSTFMILSMTIGFLLSCYFLRKNNYLWKEIVFNYSTVIISFLIGARALNYIVNYNYFKMNKISFFTLKVAHFSLYGGIISSLIIVILINKIMKKNIKVFLDILTIPFMISFFIMRIGCFLNGCCGGIYTNSVLGVRFPNNYSSEINKLFGSKFVQTISNMKVYPTQLFEGGFALLFVIIILLLKNRLRLKEGQLFLISAIYFSSFRWFVMYFRVLPYVDYVKIYLYPFIYFSTIVIGVVLLRCGKNDIV
ncbi:prolipoprotein diacylglyceryl transferase family protein [Clostridium sp. DL1XJH146]